MTDLLNIADLPEGAFAQILALSERSDLGAPLAGKGVALVFQKPSARTRNSTEMAAVQLGAHPIYIQKEEVGLGHRESAADVARTLGCYHAIIAARVTDHRDLAAMADAVEIPVLNLLSDLKTQLNLGMVFISHDIQTVRYVSDRICVMYFGKIVEQGAAEQVFDRPTNDYTKKLLGAAPSLLHI